MSLIECVRTLQCAPGAIELGDRTLSVVDIVAVARHFASVSFSKSPGFSQRIDECYKRMMQNVEDGVPVYGCNTGYGAQAAKRLNEGSSHLRHWCARSISEAIAAIDVSVGPRCDTDLVRAGMLVRINMLLHGVSAVQLSDLELLQRLLNEKITPVVNQFGGLGASGDLAHNARVVSVLRHLAGTQVMNEEGLVSDGPSTLKMRGFEPLILEPKAGLGLCNGDNFSTGAAALLAADTLEILIATLFCSAMMVEVMKGSVRVFHPMLDTLRPHPGQQQVASLMRRLLAGSQLAVQDMARPISPEEGFSVQEAYCLRGIAQYLAVPAERLLDAFEVIERNANSVSDNPIWVSPEHTTEDEPPWQWVSGANFLAMHMAEVIDGLRKSLTLMVKLCDRHLARLINPYQNKGLPANLSDPIAVTNCTFKGVQIQSGMLEVYSQVLATPILTQFGVHEEGNQDITTHALTSAILGAQNLQLARYAVAQNLLAIAQAVDLREGQSLLSPATAPVYEFIRARVSYAYHEQPMNQAIEAIFGTLVDGQLSRLMANIILGFSSEAAHE